MSMNEFLAEDKCGYEPVLERVPDVPRGKERQIAELGIRAMAEKVMGGILFVTETYEDDFELWLEHNKRELRIPDDWSFNDIKRCLYYDIQDIWYEIKDNTSSIYAGLNGETDE